MQAWVLLRGVNVPSTNPAVLATTREVPIPFLRAAEDVDLHSVLSATSIDVLAVGKPTIWCDRFDVDGCVGEVLEHCIAVVPRLHGHGEGLVLNAAGHVQFAVRDRVVVGIHDVDSEGGISEDEIEGADERISVGVQAKERESNGTIEAVVEMNAGVIDRHQKVEYGVATLEGRDGLLI